MSGEGEMSEVDARDERDLREMLQASRLRTPGAHDRRILEAARQAAGEIAAKKGAARPARPERGTGRFARRWALPLSLAAGLALAVAVLLDMPAGPGAGRAELRTGNGTPSPGDISPAHRATLHETPVEFRWAPVEGAESYRLTLMDASAEVLWTSEPSSTPALVLPPEITAVIEQGSYLWTVTIEGSGFASDIGPYWFKIER